MPRIIDLVGSVIDTDALVAAVTDPDCGAIVLFVGTTRQKTVTGEQIKITNTLFYDAYHSMALKSLEDLADQAAARWPLEGIAIVHRLGEVPIGEASIAVAISSPHRADAYAANVWLMDQIKNDVPIWKRELYADGSEEWVHPGLNG